MPDESELCTITVSGIPKQLLHDLEELAKRERRNRSNYIVKTIEEAVREARRVSKIKKQAA